MDFTSTIIMQDEYSISKAPLGQTDTIADHQIKPTAILEQPKRAGSEGVRKDDDSIQGLSSSFKNNLNLSTSKKEKEIAKSSKDVVNLSTEKEVVDSITISEMECDVERNDSEKQLIQLKGESSRVAANYDTSSSNFDPTNGEETFHIEKATGSCKTKPKSSLKSNGKKKLVRSVTWSDEIIGSSGSEDICAVKRFENIKKESDVVDNIDVSNDEDKLRRASAEACAIALSQASEAVASGDSDITDAGN